MIKVPQIYHGIINVGDLPIPFDMVLNAAVLTIVVTFVFLKVSWKESILISRETLFSTKQSFRFGICIKYDHLETLDEIYQISAEEIASPLRFATFYIRVRFEIEVR